eukprot:COSAG06_NODE_8709_length_2091_cov_2.224900_2_plen_94_part_00
MVEGVGPHTMAKEDSDPFADGVAAEAEEQDDDLFGLRISSTSPTMLWNVCSGGLECMLGRGWNVCSGGWNVCSGGWNVWNLCSGGWNVCSGML